MIVCFFVVDVVFNAMIFFTFAKEANPNTGVALLSLLLAVWAHFACSRRLLNGVVTLAVVLVLRMAMLSLMDSPSPRLMALWISAWCVEFVLVMVFSVIVSREQVRLDTLWGRASVRTARLWQLSCCETISEPD